MKRITTYSTLTHVSDHLSCVVWTLLIESLHYDNSYQLCRFADSSDELQTPTLNSVYYCVTQESAFPRTWVRIKSSGFRAHAETPQRIDSPVSMRGFRASPTGLAFFLHTFVCTQLFEVTTIDVHSCSSKRSNVRSVAARFKQHFFLPTYNACFKLKMICPLFTFIYKMSFMLLLFLLDISFSRILIF